MSHIVRAKHTGVFCAGLELPISDTGEPGRGNVLPLGPAFGFRMHMVRLEWVNGHYDAGGAYWGHVDGDHIYWLVSDKRDYVNTSETWDGNFDTRVQVFVRARSPEDAARLALEEVPGARIMI